LRLQGRTVEAERKLEGAIARRLRLRRDELRDGAFVEAEIGQELGERRREQRLRAEDARVERVTETIEPFVHQIFAREVHARGEIFGEAAAAFETPSVARGSVA
jgi:hypothetical protein